MHTHLFMKQFLQGKKNWQPGCYEVKSETDEDTLGGSCWDMGFSSVVEIYGFRPLSVIHTLPRARSVCLACFTARPERSWRESEGLRAQTQTDGFLQGLILSCSSNLLIGLLSGQNETAAQPFFCTLCQ